MSLQEGFWAGDEGVIGKNVAQRVGFGFADADAAGDLDGWSNKTVVAEPEAGVRGGEVASVVAEAGDTECLGQASGAGGEADEIARGLDFEFSSASHFFDTVKGFKGAEEDASAFTFGITGDVQAVVTAVDEIDVGVAGGAEENCVAGGFSGGGVGGKVVLCEIGFDFDDAGGEMGRVSAEEEFPEEVAGDGAGIAGEKVAWERAGAEARILLGRFTRR